MFVTAAVAVLNSAATSLEAELQKEFDFADTNHDGTISNMEFIGFFKSRHVKGGFVPNHEDGEVAGAVDMKIGAMATTEFSVNFWKAFFNSLSMILVCEMGDKTFFIAAIMAMRHDRLVIFAGAISALAVMTVLSSMIGFALPNVLPKAYTHYAGAVLFTYFGFKLLKDAYEMTHTGASEELQEVEEELNEGTDDIEDGDTKAAKQRTHIYHILVQAFTLTFLAEWGDRSQIATIALAASKDPYGVTVGGILGHSFCTGLAVIGGRLIASKISEKTVSYIGGALFIDRKSVV